MKKKQTIIALKNLPYKQALSKVKNADLMIQIDHVLKKHRRYIVALRYDPTRDTAPVIIFKATGERTIKQLEEMAKKNGILLSRSFYLTMMFDITLPTIPSAIGKPIGEEHFPVFAKAFACILKYKQSNIDHNLYDLSKAFDYSFDKAMEKE